MALSVAVHSKNYIYILPSQKRGNEAKHPKGCVRSEKSARKIGDGDARLGDASSVKWGFGGIMPATVQKAPKNRS